MRHGDDLDALRLKAKRHLKDLRSDDMSRARRGAAFFASLTRFDEIHDLDEIIRRRDEVRLKDALSLVAAELGFRTWTELHVAWKALKPVSDERLTHLGREGS